MKSKEHKAMAKTKVSSRGWAYSNDDLRDECYIGELEAISNACILVIQKPGSKLKDAIKSLEILKAELKHHIQLGQE